MLLRHCNDVVCLYWNNHSFHTFISSKNIIDLKPKMKVSVFVAFCVLLVSACTIGLTEATAAGNRVTVCYYTNWSQYRYGAGKFLPENIDPHLCTHIVYAFAQIDDATHQVKNYEWNDDVMIKRVMALKAVNPDLKVICSVGKFSF